MKVRELMVTNVAVCGPNDTLNDAARILWERVCGCVPVVDDERRLVGMVTDRDICMAAYIQGESLINLHVNRAMTPDVCACSPDDSLRTVEQLMRERVVRRLPVTDDEGKLIGILSLNDIARAATSPATRRRRDITDAEIAQTLGALCEAHVRAKGGTAS